MSAAYEYAVEVVRARGHPNVRALHRTTFEVTRDSHLTPRGDCIIGVSADKAPTDFSAEFRRIASSDDSYIIVLLHANGVSDVAVGRGSSRLELSDSRRMVFRRSSYVEPGTVAVGMDKAAKDLDRRLVRKLKNPETTLIVYLVALRTSRSTA